MKVPARGRDFRVDHDLQTELRGATLTVAILVIFLVLVLTEVALLGRVLTRLAGLAALTRCMLTGLPSLLTLAILAARLTAASLTLLLHIVCHKYSS